MRAVENLTHLVQGQVERGKPVWFFLDYDGTLADFAPTPDIVEPDPQLIHILGQLARQSNLRLTLISGRMLSQIRILVPLEDIYLAGTYGVEIQLPSGEVIQRVSLQTIRTALERVKEGWTNLVQNLNGYFIEDKNWAVAMHARFAERGEADSVLDQARIIAGRETGEGDLQLLGGDRFLEIGPTLAHKGETVAWMLDNFPLPEALLVYLGDDDKDEQAFAVIHARGGLCVLVGPRLEDTKADYHLDDPSRVRKWLNNWLDHGDT
ncbi:MAG: trehalose-phosphatase [Anaerolineales bacterium]